MEKRYENASNADATNGRDAVDALTRHLTKELSSIDTSAMNEHRDDAERENAIRLDIPITVRHIENFARELAFTALKLAATPLREFASLPPWVVRFFFFSSLSDFVASCPDEYEDVATEMREAEEQCREEGCDLDSYSLLYDMASNAAYGAASLLISILAGEGDGKDIRFAFLPKVAKGDEENGVFSTWTSELWTDLLLGDIRKRVAFSAAGAQTAVERACWTDKKLSLRDWLLRETKRFVPKEEDSRLRHLNRIAILETSSGADIAKAIGEETLPELVEFVRVRFTGDGELSIDDLRSALRHERGCKSIRDSSFGELLASMYGFDFIEDSTNYDPVMPVYLLPGVGPMTMDALLVHATERIVRFLDEPSLPSAAAMLRGAAWFCCETERHEYWNPVHAIAERLLAMRIEANVLETAASLAPRGVDGRAFLAGPAERFVEDERAITNFIGFEKN